MTTRGPSFDFTGFDEISQTFSREDAQSLIAGPELAGLLPPGTIGTQVAGQGAGVPMSAIRRGLLTLTGRTSANYSITATSFAEVDSTNLAGVLVCTGRPVFVGFSATAMTKGLNWLLVTIAMDGVDVSGRANGLWFHTASTQGATAFTVVTPRPGPRRFALMASVDAGTGTISATASNLVSLFAVEL